MKPSRKIRLKKKTPSGGVYLHIFYLDEHGRPTDKDRAKTVHVWELDENKKKVKESHFFTD
jgi:hypothetical protein